MTASRVDNARYGERQKITDEPLVVNQVPGIGVDDDPEHFPEDAVGRHVLLTDLAIGFRARAASRLRQMLIPLEQRSIA